MPKSASGPEFAQGGAIPEAVPAEVAAGEAVPAEVAAGEAVLPMDDGEAGVLAAAEAANYIQAQADYTPIREGE